MYIPSDSLMEVEHSLLVKEHPLSMDHTIHFHVSDNVSGESVPCCSTSIEPTPSTAHRLAKGHHRAIPQEIHACQDPTD